MELNFLTSRVSCAFIAIYRPLHKRVRFTRTQPIQRYIVVFAHAPDLINLRLIYLLLAQNVNNATLKVKLKSIVQERVSEHCALLCYANQYVETESVTIA